MNRKADRPEIQQHHPIRLINKSKHVLGLNAATLCCDSLLLLGVGAYSLCVDKPLLSIKSNDSEIEALTGSPSQHFEFRISIWLREEPVLNLWGAQKYSGVYNSTSMLLLGMQSCVNISSLFKLHM